MAATSQDTAPGIETLFRPIRIGSMDLPNRIVMAPMNINSS